LLVSLSNPNFVRSRLNNQTNFGLGILDCAACIVAVAAEG
jgi:hypothetical protein